MSDTYTSYLDISEEEIAELNIPIAIILAVVAIVIVSIFIFKK